MVPQVFQGVPKVLNEVPGILEGLRKFLKGVPSVPRGPGSPKYDFTINNILDISPYTADPCNHRQVPQ